MCLFCGSIFSTVCIYFMRWQLRWRKSIRVFLWMSRRIKSHIPVDLCVRFILFFFFFRSLVFFFFGCVQLFRVKIYLQIMEKNAGFFFFRSVKWIFMLYSCRCWNQSAYSHFLLCIPFGAGYIAWSSTYTYKPRRRMNLLKVDGPQHSYAYIVRLLHVRIYTPTFGLACYYLVHSTHFIYWTEKKSQKLEHSNNWWCTNDQINGKCTTSEKLLGDSLKI